MAHPTSDHLATAAGSARHALACGHRGSPRRRVLTMLSFLVLSAVLVPRSGSAHEPIRLFVFVTTDVRPRALEQELAAVLPGIQVRVFGRARELEAAVKQDRPEALLARPVVLDTLRLVPTLRGARHGTSWEPYVLVSVGRALKPSDLGNQDLGAVDLIGRDAMKSFVSRVLGAPAPKLKLVTTEHDLLPLLHFGEVVAVLMPERWVELLRRKSNLDLRTTPLPNSVELPALSCSSDWVRSVLEPRVRAWKSGMNARFGVDEWK